MRYKASAVDLLAYSITRQGSDESRVTRGRDKSALYRTLSCARGYGLESSLLLVAAAAAAGCCSPSPGQTPACDFARFPRGALPPLPPAPPLSPLAL